MSGELSCPLLVQKYSKSHSGNPSMDTKFVIPLKVNYFLWSFYGKSEIEQLSGTHTRLD